MLFKSRFVALLGLFGLRAALAAPVPLSEVEDADKALSRRSQRLKRSASLGSLVQPVLQTAQPSADGVDAGAGSNVVANGVYSASQYGSTASIVVSGLGTAGASASSLSLPLQGNGNGNPFVPNPTLFPIYCTDVVRDTRSVVSATNGNSAGSGGNALGGCRSATASAVC